MTPEEAQQARQTKSNWEILKRAHPRLPIRSRPTFKNVIPAPNALIFLDSNEGRELIKEEEATPVAEDRRFEVGQTMDSWANSRMSYASSRASTAITESSAGGDGKLVYSERLRANLARQWAKASSSDVTEISRDSISSQSFLEVPFALEQTLAVAETIHFAEPDFNESWQPLFSRRPETGSDLPIRATKHVETGTVRWTSNDSQMGRKRNSDETIHGE